nr:hypothetical protein BaRGS_025410 [Batillaria attramentaria]
MHDTDTTLGDRLTETVTKETLIRQCLEVKAPRIYRTTTPMAEHTNDIWSECGATPEVAQTPKPVFPPWELAKPEMENYTKGATTEVDDPYPFADVDDALQMRVTQGSKIRNLMGFAMKRMTDKETRQIAWNGSGFAVTKTITCAEIMKRKIKDRGTLGAKD